MMLRASVYLSFGQIAVNVWTESQDAPDGPLVVRSVRHDYIEVPEVLAKLSEDEQCLEALRWAVRVALEQRRARRQ